MEGTNVSAFKEQIYWIPLIPLSHFHITDNFYSLGKVTYKPLPLP